MSKHLATPERRPRPLPLVALGALVMAGATAGIVAFASDDDEPAAGTEQDTDAGFDTAIGETDGTVLPPFSGAASDPAVGEAAPVVNGVGLDGDPVTVPREGRPALLLFLAHWCPHCQQELEETVRWLEGGPPDDVDLVAVATHIDASRVNHPPSAWLNREGWSLPAVADADLTVGNAYGLSEVPYWVVVDGDGEVVARLSGGQSQEAIDQLVAAARG